MQLSKYIVIYVCMFVVSNKEVVFLLLIPVCRP